MFARKSVQAGAAGWLLSMLCWAQPSLTTISDVVYKADGTRFNGLAQFTWVSFETGNGSNVGQQQKTVRIIDGNVFVQLAPTTNAVPQSVYVVKYSSDGKIQFQETWAVPPTSATLRVRDVRTTQPTFPGGGIGAVTSIQESDVIGLVGDLAIRAIKGPGFASSRTAVINDTGQLEGALGSPSDCVRVDGSTGACGSGGSSVTFVDKEVPGGAINGTNLVFTVANAPSPATSLHLYRNGVLQRAGVDYTLSGVTITFAGVSVPGTGDGLSASYRR